MKTKKIQRLKILVSVLIVANTLTCFGTEAMTVGAALIRDKIATVLYFAAVIVNVVVAGLLMHLHDAIVDELNERQDKSRTNSGKIIKLYDINTYETSRARTEAD